MAALLHRAYTPFWSSMVSPSGLSGIIRHDLSMYAILLNGSGECNRGCKYMHDGHLCAFASQFMQGIRIISEYLRV